MFCWSLEPIHQSEFRTVDEINKFRHILRVGDLLENHIGRLFARRTFANVVDDCAEVAEVGGECCVVAQGVDDGDSENGFQIEESNQSNDGQWT